MSQRTRVCVIKNCTKVGRYAGWCQGHRALASPEELLAAKTKRSGECLIWVTTSKSGYAGVRINGRSIKAHRYVWELTHGEVPVGFDIDHVCHNRACVNVDHLRLATRSQNAANRSGSHRGSKSGIRNVFPKRGKWRVRIVKDGVRHDLGTYESLSVAAQVAKTNRARIFGEYAGKG